MSDNRMKSSADYGKKNVVWEYGTGNICYVINCSFYSVTGRILKNKPLIVDLHDHRYGNFWKYIYFVM